MLHPMGLPEDVQVIAWGLSLKRRLSIGDLISSTPVYNSSTDVSGEGLSPVLWLARKRQDPLQMAVTCCPRISVIRT
ncbi:ribosomal protein L27 [Salvia divinorum]|uniref:Ribosomal protein L27 n=1 Tax=Salvia divinorum TaxID=28513 RepID=A0ABD1I0P2_SALDI